MVAIRLKSRKLSGSGDEAQREQRRVDHALVAQDRAPGVDAHQVAGKERHHHQQEQDLLMRRR